MRLIKSMAWFALVMASRRGLVSGFVQSGSKSPSFARRSIQNNFQTRLKASLQPATVSSSSNSITSLLEEKLEVTHPAYDVLAKDVVSEYGAYCTLYQHKKSGAQLLSVATEDDNKVFGITFRTPPNDSTGVAHILEHSVLCGSRKYPTKDPFVQLLQGSLQTFLNAFTYPDRTCYVVASQNTKDFYNLINVYTDAVFYPRAKDDDRVHAQEGWHLELEDKQQPLTYKGVVYNEMKGVYSSPDSLLMRASQNSLFPDNTYAVDSGGDPTVIPKLSFNDFCDFHNKFYHPVNARIYFSGDDDIETRLNLMDEYLKDFDKEGYSADNSKIAFQTKSFTQPIRKKLPFPSEEQQHMVMVNWLLNDKPMSEEEEITWNVLDHLLMGTQSSILRKTLLESGLGTAITGGGLGDELLQSTFMLGLKGVKTDDVAKVEELITSTLEKVVEEGFSDDAIAASMNTLEFSLREFNTGSYPKGLSFMLGSMSNWVYDRSPTSGLKFEEPLAALKKKIKESGSKVFTDYVKTYLLDNVHRSTVEMEPSPTQEKEVLEEEKTRLEGIKSKLSDSDLDGIIQKTKELKEFQAAEDTPEARATVPSLSLSDLKREITEYPIEVKKEHGISVARHELVSTSGIVYASFGTDLSQIPLEDVPLLSLFARMLTGTGAGDMDDVALSRQIGTHTGGVGASLLLTPVLADGVDESTITDCETMVSKLVITGKATADKADKLFDLMKLVLEDAHLDSQKKVIEMLKERKAQMESSVQGSGHSYALQRMRSRYTASGYIDEIMKGVTHLEDLKSMLDQAENDWPTFLKRLESIRSILLDSAKCRDGMFISLTGDNTVLNTIQPSLDNFLSSLPGSEDGEKLPDFYKEAHPWVTQAKAKMPEIKDEGIVVPSQVSYVGKGGRLYDKGETLSGAATVVARYLQTSYLWDRVRVMGGAYGAFNILAQGSGFFGFLSYRDPNLSKTLDVYDATADALDQMAANMDQDVLEQAIIGAIGDMDSPKSPDQKGWSAFMQWITRSSPEHRQRFRNQVLDTKPQDFMNFADRLRKLKDPSVAVVSSKGALDQAIQEGKKLSLIEVK